MATIALPLRRRAAGISALSFALVVGTIGTLLSWFGSGWDVSWHRIYGRDTFWSTPHLFIYTGVTMWGIAALVATATAMRGRPIRGRALVIGPLRAELGLALVGVGALVTIAAGPFDNFWHSFYGRDVDIWSPPHLFGIVGGAIGLLGWVSAYGRGVLPVGEAVRRVLRLMTFGNLCAVCIFAMNFYYISAIAREAFFYPLLVAALVPLALGIAASATPGRWAATTAALAYTTIALGGYVLLAGTGWRPPAFPPLVVAGALAIDLLRGWGRRWAHPLALGLGFTLAFVGAELFRMAVFGPRAPLADAELRFSGIFFQYYEQAVARPWLSLWPIAAAVVGAPLAAVSWRVGGWIGARLGDDRNAEAFAHP
jgi:hypothetical protein